MAHHQPRGSTGHPHHRRQGGKARHLYQENYGDSPVFNGWLDVGDVILAGDFLHRGYDQLLCCGSRQRCRRPANRQLSRQARPADVRCTPTPGRLARRLAAGLMPATRSWSGTSAAWDTISCCSSTAARAPAASSLVTDLVRAARPARRATTKRGQSPICDGFGEMSDIVVSGDFAGRGWSQVLFPSVADPKSQGRAGQALPHRRCASACRWRWRQRGRSQRINDRLRRRDPAGRRLAARRSAAAAGNLRASGQRRLQHPGTPGPHRRPGLAPGRSYEQIIVAVEPAYVIIHAARQQTRTSTGCDVRHAHQHVVRACRAELTKEHRRRADFSPADRPVHPAVLIEPGPDFRALGLRQPVLHKRLVHDIEAGIDKDPRNISASLGGRAGGGRGIAGVAAGGGSGSSSMHAARLIAESRSSRRSHMRPGRPKPTTKERATHKRPAKPGQPGL